MRDILDLKPMFYVLYLPLFSILYGNIGFSQLNDSYCLDTTSYIAIVQSPPSISGNNKWYTENVYFRVHKDFIVKGGDNIFDFFINNSDRKIIMSVYDNSDLNDLISVTRIVGSSKETYKNYLKIRIVEFKKLYVKTMPGVQFPFGDSITYKDYPIRLEKVFIQEGDNNYVDILEMNLLFIDNGISFNQIDFWEYIRDKRYIHYK